MNEGGLQSAMERLIGADGGEILWWQMSLRAVVIFLFGLLVVRLLGRRVFGKHMALDIVVAIVIGSNLSRTLTGNAPFVPTLATTLTLFLCFWAVERLAAVWHGFGRLVKGEPILLAHHGELNRRRMRRAGISEGDIAEAARRAGLTGLDELDRAMLERSGKISVTARRE